MEASQLKPWECILCLVSPSIPLLVIGNDIRRKIFPFQVVSYSICWRICRGSLADYLTLADD